MQLQALLASEHFVRIRKEHGEEFDKLMETARKTIDRFTNAESGHSSTSPFPPIATFNGPIASGRDGITFSEGRIVCCDDQPGWHPVRFQPTSSSEGVHHFRVIFGTGGLCRLGWSTNTCSGADLGEDTESIALQSDGKLFACGSVQDTGINFSSTDVVDLFVDYGAQELSFVCNGSKHCVSLAEFDTLRLPLCPIVALQPPCAFETQIFGTQLDLSISPKCIVQDELACFFSKAPLNESPLGIGLHVERHGGSITDISSGWDVLSQASFEKCKVRRGVHNEPFEFWIPLSINQDATASLRTIQNVLVNISRDPSASTLYTPPFRPPVAAKTLPKLFTSLVSMPKGAYLCEAATDRWIFGYQQLRLILSSLVEKHAAIRKEAEEIVNDCLSSGNCGAFSKCPLDLLTLLALCDTQSQSPLLLIIVGAILDGSKAASSSEAFTSCQDKLQALMVTVLLLQKFEGGVPTELSTTDEKTNFFASCQSVYSISDWVEFCTKTGIDQSAVLELAAARVH